MSVQPTQQSAGPETVTCGQTCASCVCVKTSGHVEQDDPIHACDSSCGGAWTGTEGTDDWTVVSFPLLNRRRERP
jgi:hypothetical protein